MSIKGKACIAGVYEHPTRKAADKSVFRLHAEVAKGALQNAGMSMRDVDGYFCAVRKLRTSSVTSPSMKACR